VAFTALFELTAPPARLGINLFTAEASLTLLALLLLGDSVRRLAGAD